MPPSHDLLGPSIDHSFLRKARVTYKHYLDVSVPHRGLRWCFFAFLAILYVARVVTFGGFYVITYGLCIHLLYLLLAAGDSNPPHSGKRAGGGEKVFFFSAPPPPGPGGGPPPPFFF
ncbi:rer1 family-like protein [Leishmania braziliensis MHOM/BR/75/M2904]|uniref:Rer1 family-like protein n=1 Tax=Leishmania braziliensis TaxID=5660 RepID=A4HCA2_LEIBR|nr:rer1 family-like protein [Leishmania braziliensis MHOM/BR/75/M2904]CAM45096.1 rer1 family-like protein [Leishmania braziliensis MHOM/BR/75/M2904]